MNQTETSLSIASRGQQTSAAGLDRPRIAFVRAGWHADIVGQALVGFSAECERLWPGASPAIVCCALVVDGGIYRHDFVAHAVVDGLMRVQLDSGVPVLSVVLTPKDFHEHESHHALFTQHFVAKGAEAARAVAQTLRAHAALGD